MDSDLMRLAIVLLFVALMLRSIRRIVTEARKAREARQRAELVETIDWRRTKAPPVPRRSRIERLFLG